MTPKLTKEQAAIIGAFTGVLCGPPRDVQEYAEKLLGRPLWSCEILTERGSEELMEAARADFLAICYGK